MENIIKKYIAENEKNKRLQKEIQEQLEKGPLKPDSINPNQILQQNLTPIKKKEPVKTIEVKEKEERVEAPKVEQFAPIPMGANIEE